MKNNKGFTLVEILAVIVILAVIMIIAVPNVMNTLGAGKGALTSIQKKGIEDASKQLITEVLQCDLSVENYDALSITNTYTCDEVQDLVIGKTVEVTVQKLKDNKYFTDDADNCDGTTTVKISTDSNYKITVDTSEVVCK